jgi:hypothetical protein
MAAARYTIQRTRPLRRGLSFIEFALAVVVMGGMVYVTIRIKNLAVHESHAQASVMKLETGPNGSPVKMP